MQQLQVEYEQALTRKQQAEELLASLQANVARAQLVGYIDALSAARPQSVELLQTDYQNDSLVLSGRASDMQAISAFTSKLEGGGAFHSVQLQQVAHSDGVYEFEILLHIPPQSNTPPEDDPHEVE